MNPPMSDPADGELPWTTQTETDDDGRWRRVTWAITGQGLREALLDSTPNLSERSLPAWPSRVSSVLLLTDVITLDATLVALTLFAGPEPNAGGSLRIEARLTCERELRGPLLARLGWAGRTLSADVDDSGKVAFNGVPLDALIDRGSGQARSGLHLTLERSAPPPG